MCICAKAESFTSDVHYVRKCSPGFCWNHAWLGSKGHYQRKFKLATLWCTIIALFLTSAYKYCEADAKKWPNCLDVVCLKINSSTISLILMRRKSHLDDTSSLGQPDPININDGLELCRKAFLKSTILGVYVQINCKHPCFRICPSISLMENHVQLHLCVNIWQTGCCGVPMEDTNSWLALCHCNSHAPMLHTHIEQDHKICADLKFNQPAK